MDALTLLAEPTESNVRAHTLRTDDEHFVFSVKVHEESEGTYLHLHCYMHGLGYFHLFMDAEGGLFATAIAPTDEEATELVRERISAEARIELTHNGSWLLAEHPNEKRRSVLGGDRLSARAKAYIPEDDEEEMLLRLRLYESEYGHVQVVISNYGRLVAAMSGRTDADVYNRIRGELARKGIELE